MFAGPNLHEPVYQLHVILNYKQIPQAKLPLLLQHLLGRASYSHFACVNVTPDRTSVLGFRFDELDVDRNGFHGNALERIGQYLDCERRVLLGEQRLWKFEKSCTAITILGVGHPDAFDNQNLVYGLYKNISGIGAVGPLAEYLHKHIVERYLRAGGLVRVQVCHAASAKLPNSVYSFARVVGGNFQCLAPECFSVVHPSGAFLDVLCTMSDFQNHVCKAFLRSENKSTPLQLPPRVILRHYEPRPAAPPRLLNETDLEEDFVNDQLL
jgi:hypothetical protein